MEIFNFNYIFNEYIYFFYRNLNSNYLVILIIILFNVKVDMIYIKEKYGCGRLVGFVCIFL